MTASTTNPTHHFPHWVATAYVNYSAALPMIETDLRRVHATSPHHAEAIACRALLEEIGLAHIICAVGKPEQDAHIPPKEEAPAAPVAPAAPPQETYHTTLADVRAQIENLRGQITSTTSRQVNVVQVSIATYQKLEAALLAAKFEPGDAEIQNIATTLLGHPVTPKQPMREAEGRALLAFLENVQPALLDIIFPIQAEVSA